MNKAVKRSFLMISGILSVIVIVLTQSFYQSTEVHEKKIASEKTADQNAREVSISAPSDVMPHGNTVAVSENTPHLAERIREIKQPKEIAIASKSVCIALFKTLFRVTIAPNAP